MRKMGNKVKEDERIEGIIRGLLKLPENRRCINCNSLGPQYVCTTFLTFICTNCSGVHREFTHRVKSISMAKFTADEVCALQVAGNEFPSMTSLQGTIPNAGLLSTSNVASHSPGLMALQSPSYASGMPPQSPSFSPAMSSGALMGQQIHTNMTPTRLQGIDGFGSDRTIFGNKSQQQVGE